MNSIVRRPWTPDVSFTQEDGAIQKLVALYGDKNWADISKRLFTHHAIKGRTGKQCRERWHNHLDPNIKPDDWTEPEEVGLFELHRVYGNRWSEIAKLLPGRTDNAVKNHFYSTIRRNIRKYNKHHTSGALSMNNLGEILENPSISQEILRANYQNLKKTKKERGPVRKSQRSLGAICYKIESSDEEETAKLCVPAKKPKRNEERDIDLLCNLIESARKGVAVHCPSPTSPFEGPFTPSWYLVSAPGKYFSFSEENPQTIVTPRKVSVLSPTNFRIP